MAKRPHPETDPAAPGREAEEAAGGDEETAEEQAGEVASELEELVADLRRERDEYLGLAQRAKADFDNFRKRAAREATEAERRGRASLAREVMPSIDNLERALRAAGIADTPAGTQGEQPSEEVSAHEALARGVALVHGELQAALARAGVEAYDPLGERFDPNHHEAISTRPAQDGDAGTVVETLERGYRLDGQTLRPARVIVGE